MDFYFWLAQLFCQLVYHVIHGVYFSYLDIFLFEVVAYDVEPSFDVLEFLMRSGLLSKYYGSIIVAVQWYGIQYHYTKLCDELFESKAFLCSIWSSDIFNFSSQIYYDGLLRTLLADCATIAYEHILWRRLSIIKIRREVWISKTFDSQLRPSFKD